MNKKILRLLKIIGIFLCVVLILEIGYILFFIKDKPIYFDGINSIISVDKSLVAVGSNNNNESHFEKAKITKYNAKKEKKFETIYNKGYNGAFFDVIDDDENLVAVGSYEMDIEEHEKSVRSALIVKYDNEGNLVYENNFSVLDNSKFTSILNVEDGYIVTGQSIYDDMTVGLSSVGGAFVIKYNKELEVEWKEDFGDSKTAIFNDAIVIDDYIYTVGKTDSIFGVIAKYDMDGNLIQSTKFEHTDNFGFTGLVYSNDSLFVSSSIKNNDNYDAIIIKYNLDLVYKSQVVYSNDSYERYNRIVTDEHDNIIVIGTAAQIDNRDQSINVFNHDGLIAKYDKDLEKISVVNYGDENDDYFTDIIIVDGNYLVSRYSYYKDGSYLSKFITYSNALKTLEVE